MYIKATLAPGEAVTYWDQAEMFRLLGSQTDDVSVTFYRNGGVVAEVESIGAGYAERFSGGFDRLVIESAGGGVVSFVTRTGGDVRYDTPPNGVVTVTNTSGAVVQTTKGVTGVASNAVAEKAGRRYLLIQNNDASGTVFVNFSGPAVVGSGLKIPPGASYSADGSFCPSNAVSVITGGAALAVTVLEG